MFGKKNKPTIDLQDDKERKAMELAALEASLDFLKNPAKPEGDGDQADGEGVKELTAADRARAQKFGRRMDYKTAVVKRGNNSETEENDPESAEAVTEVPKQEENAVSESIPETAAETAAEITDNVTAGENAVEAAKEPETDDQTEEELTGTAEEEAEAGEEKDEKKSGLIIAEAPVPDTGEEAPKLIENPLPTPKKHVPREMDFDIEPDADHMHFDVVDMKGQDFFDIN